MLPKIISNIILALIAIFIIYTLAPLVKDYLMTFLGAPKKKNYSRDEFEDLVKRKAQMLSSTTRASASTTTTKLNPQATRDELDYLIDNHFFSSDEEKEKFQELKRELTWGQGEGISKFKFFCEKYLDAKMEDKLYTQTLKSGLTKNSLLNLFPQKGIKLETFFDLLAFNILIKNISNKNIIEHLSKQLQISVTEVSLLVVITIKKEQNQNWLATLDDFISDGVIENENIMASKNFRLTEFINLMKKNIDIIAPLPLLNENAMLQGLTGKEGDFIKKKHKKLLSLYHPDKWSFEKKTDLIDKRLRENFDIVQKIFQKL